MMTNLLTFDETFIHSSIRASKMAEVCSQYIRWWVQLEHRELCRPHPPFFGSSGVSGRGVPSDTFLLRIFPFCLL